MKKLRLFASIAVLGILNSLQVSAQEKGANLSREITHLKKTLVASDDVALKVDSIMKVYKASVKKLTEDPRLTVDEKRAKYILAVKEKHRGLSPLLTEVQISKIMPTTELKAIQ